MTHDHEDAKWVPASAPANGSIPRGLFDPPLPWVSCFCDFFDGVFYFFRILPCLAHDRASRFPNVSGPYVESEIKSQYKPLWSKDHQGVCYETFSTMHLPHLQSGCPSSPSSKVNVLESNFLFFFVVMLFFLPIPVVVQTI